MKHHELSAQIDDVEGQIRDSVTTSFPDVEPGRLKDIGTAISIMQGKTLLVTSRVDALGPALLGQPPMLTLLKDLSDAMPPAKEARIDIRELTLSEAAASFTAETDGYEAAAKIEASLQRKSRFKRAAKGEEKKVGEGVSFSLTIPLKESSESEEIAMEVTVAAEPAAPEPVSVEPEKPPVTPPGAGSAKLARPDVKVRAKARKKKETMP
jgi:hypothetical protein